MKFVSIELYENGEIHVEETERDSFLYDFYFTSKDGKPVYCIKCKNNEEEILTHKKRLIKSVLKEMLNDRKELSRRIKTYKEKLINK